MKRNIELIRDFIKFVESDMKEKYDYYDHLKQPVPQEELKKYDDILHRAYILLEEELDYRAGAFDVEISQSLCKVAEVEVESYPAWLCFLLLFFIVFGFCLTNFF